MILTGVENQHNWVYAQHLGQSKRDQNLGKIECVFSMYDTMGWR